MIAGMFLGDELEPRSRPFLHCDGAGPFVSSNRVCLPFVYFSSHVRTGLFKPLPPVGRRRPILSDLLAQLRALEP